MEAEAQLFPRIYISSLEGHVRSARFQKRQLSRLHETLVKEEQELKRLIIEDAGNTTQEAEVELLLTLSDLVQLQRAVSSEKALLESRQVELGNDNPDRRRSLGITYVVPSNHTLVYSVVSVICAAIVAGSCVIVELPKTLRLPSLTGKLRQLLVDSLDADIFAVSDTRPPSSFLRHCTLVIQEERQNEDETPQWVDTLKSKYNRTIAVVDRGAELAQAAAATARACFSRGGNSPYAPELVLVNEFVFDEFTSHLLEYLAQQPKEGGKESQILPALDANKRKPQTQDLQDILENRSKSDGVKVVFHESGGSIVEVPNRSSHLLRQKPQGSVLMIHRTSSFDDNINFILDIHGSETLAAAYIFASLPGANYIANNINTHISCINHIPLELMIGPLGPSEHPLSRLPRYLPSMLTKSQSQYLHRSDLSSMLEDKDHENRIAALSHQLRAPLDHGKIIKKPGNFFLQGLLTGVLMFTISTALVGLGAVRLYNKFGGSKAFANVF